MKMNLNTNFEVRIQETPTSGERIIATVKSWSSYRNVDVRRIAREVKKRFSSVNLEYPMSHIEVRRAVAYDIADGWKRNGPWPQATLTVRPV